MGGNAFASGPEALYTPRMGPSVYNHVKAQCTNALKELGFTRVVTPIEAPEKDNFGDVDILACLEGTTFPLSAQLDASAWDLIEKSMGAVRSYSEGRIGPDKRRIIDSKSLAIPWPAALDSAEDEPAAESGEDVQDLGVEKAVGSEAASGSQYIQVDVRLCDTHQELEWRFFKHNHGDLWNMIGQTIRPFGLTADEIGLYIRIPEIERLDKKKARVFLSSDPSKVLDFLGLSRLNGEWEKPFESVRDLFEYAASSKWFILWPKDQDAEEKTTIGDDAKVSAGKEVQEDLKKLKANDRARMKQRPAFARWVNEFIPACRAEGRFMVSNPEEHTKEDVRDDVRQIAFKTFPGSEAAYNSALADWNKERTRIFVKNKIIKDDVCLPSDIKPFLPSLGGGDGNVDTGTGLPDLEKHWRGVLRSALAKIIVDDDETFEGIVPPRLRNADGVLEVDDVKDWINRNWFDVGRVAWTANCARSRESMERKRKAAEETQEDEATAAATGGE
ncbi:hypothetical protein Daus18300_005875 [Diaporthe australafricana]|uniref:Uncharacterized protein n=1 Tax=Diaporthe australafricana TaxID=127596 RepID=A0ABR3WYI5_9PEZI